MGCFAPIGCVCFALEVLCDDTSISLSLKPGEPGESEEYTRREVIDTSAVVEDSKRGCGAGIRMLAASPGAGGLLAYMGLLT